MGVFNKTLEHLGINEITDMLNPEVRQTALVAKLLDGIDKDLIEDEPSFLAWLRNKGRFFLWLFLLTPMAATTYVITRFFVINSNYRIEPIFRNSPYQIYIDHISETMIHLGVTILVVVIAVIGYMALHSPNPKTKIYSNNPFIIRAMDSAKAVSQYWLLVWVTWFFFYLTLTFNWFMANLDTNLMMSLAFSKALANLFNNTSAVFFFCMYYEMSHETRDRETDNFWSLPIFLFLIFIVLSILEFIILSRNSADEIMFNKYNFYFSLFSGLCNGVAMGLLISRLESIILSTPLFLVSFFILYAVIQPTIYFLTDNSRVELSFILILLAFYGKILLFITITWLKDTNRLTYYLVRWLYIYQQEIDLHLRGLFFKRLKEEEEELLKKTKKNVVKEQSSKDENNQRSINEIFASIRQAAKKSGASDEQVETIITNMQKGQSQTEKKPDEKG